MILFTPGRPIRADELNEAAETIRAQLIAIRGRGWYSHQRTAAGPQRSTFALLLGYVMVQ